MQVGYNHYAYNHFGSQIGPYLHQPDADWDKQNRLEGEGKLDQIPLPALFNDLDRNLADLNTMGITVVRWFLLGNGNNYGPSPIRRYLSKPSVAVGGDIHYPDYNFAPPTHLDGRFRRDFTEMLARFKKAGMRIIPSLLSFEFSGAPDFTTGPHPYTGSHGRADVLRDRVKRKIFLDTMLAELLAASAPFREQIYAWEVINEPIWMVQDISPNSKPSWTARIPEVTPAELKEFLDDALGRIAAAKLPSTVGHRYFEDLTKFPTGSLPQFHYYADPLWHRAASEVSKYESDPGGIAGKGLFRGSPKPFLGEFASGHNGNGGPWPDPGTRESTPARLELLANEGCDLALIWGDVPAADDKDPIRLQDDTRRAIVKYTGGKLPPTRK